ncbi:MAG: hypothetical protein IPL83_01980 [Bdellovibrionales bacterium]|nr:hypothetical protein [Bdellovibrionales bacterium]
MADAEIQNYTPPKKSFYEKMQWQRALRKTESEKAAPSGSPGESSSDKLWASLSERYQNTFDIKLDPEAQNEWVEDAKARVPLAQSMGGRVGLHIEDPDNSPFVQEVILQAVFRTENALGLPNEVAYTKTLTNEERVIYEAQIFTEHFLDIYVERSVHSHDHMRSDSPEYPGRLQFVRRALVGKPGEKFFSGVVRVAEAFFRNEETSYKPGFWKMVERSLPLIPDAFLNSFRIARVLPYALLFGYPVSYYVWQIHLPFILYAVLVASGGVHMMIVEFNNRIMKNFNIKPMNDVASKLIYAWIHSRGTNLPAGAIQVTADRAVEAYDTHVVQPAQRAIDSAVIQPAREIIGRCRGLLGASAEKP